MILHLLLLISSFFLLIGCSSIQNTGVDLRLIYLDDYLNNANSEYLVGNYERAELLARKALSLDNCNSLALDIIGLCKIKNDDIEEAERDFYEAIRCNPLYHKGYTHLAVVYHLKGDRESAWKLLQKAYDINPMDMEIDEVKVFLLKSENDLEVAYEN